MAVAEDIGAVAPAAQTDSRPTAGVRAAYSLGQAVESGYLVVNGFVFFYYTAVLGLSGSMVGAAVAISMCLDAAFDPLIGSWSDSIRSRLGRRLPPMLLGAPLTLLTMGLLFAPPEGLSPFLLFGWLTLSKMGLRAFASMFNIPYFALGGEMSDDYAERSRIVAWRLLAGIIITVVVTALASLVFFAGDHGLQKAERYPSFGWSIGGMILVMALISCAGVWRFATSLPQPKAAEHGMLRRIVPEVVEIFRNRSFRVLFLSLLIFASASGIHAALNLHNYVFVWKLRPEVMQVLTYANLLGITAAVPLTPVLLRRLEKKTVVGLGFVLLAAGWTVLPSLRAADLFMLTGAVALPWLAGNGLVVGFGYGLIFIAYPSMMADAADEHEHLFQARREGLYFAGLGFAGKAAGGVGTMVGGFALDALRFPHAVGAAAKAGVDESVLSGLALAWGPLPALLALVGILIFLPYAISRTRHEQILDALRRQRATAG